MTNLPPLISWGTAIHDQILAMLNCVGASGFLVYLYVSTKKICQENRIRITATLGVALELFLLGYLVVFRSIPNEWIELYYFIKFVAVTCVVYALLSVALEKVIAGNKFRVLIAGIIGLLFLGIFGVAWQSRYILREACLAESVFEPTKQIDHIKKAMKSDSLLSKAVRNELKYRLSYAYMMAGKYDKSLELLPQLKNDKDYAFKVIVLEAINYRDIGSYEHAAVLVEQALKLNNNVPYLMELKSIILMNLKQMDAAISILDKTIYLYPNSGSSRFIRGTALMIYTNRYKDAADDLKRYYDISKDCKALVYKGFCEVELKEYEQASASFNQASHQDEFVCNSMPWTALVSLRKGDLKSAEQIYHEAKSNNADVPEVAVSLYNKKLMPKTIFKDFNRLIIK